MMDKFSEENTRVPVPYAPALIRLLQGVVYSDDRTAWDLVLRYKSLIEAYFLRMGLHLYLAEEDGYAYLFQPDIEDETGAAIELPRLTQRRELTYSTTLVLVLLREALNQFDSTNIENNKLRISHDELLDMLRPFYRSREDERAIIKAVNSDINNVVSLGFLKKIELEGQLYYIVRPILKARVNSDELDLIKMQLEQHAHDESK
jgi:hypothetical protein